jgi:hypothetical protein
VTAEVACPTCSRTGPLALGPPRELTLDTVAVLVERAPVVGCPDRHQATPPAIVDAAMQATTDALPRARGRWLRDDACRRCGTRLTMPVRRTTRPVTVEPPGGPVFTLRFDLPSTRCPDCGLDQVPSRSQEDLVVAVPAVFVRG